MPIFEYTCDQCDRRFETIVLSPSSTTGEVIACRYCGSAEVTRALSTFAAHSASPGSRSKAAPSSGGGGGCGRPGGCGCH